MTDMQVYEILDAFDPKDRWYLGSPIDSHGRDVDPRIFTGGRAVQILENLFVPVTAGSHPLDFTLAAFDMPVVRRDIAEALQTLEPSSIQRIPVTIEPELEGYDILNVTCTLPCLDERRSEIVWWTAEDERPDKVGSYRGIGNKMLLAESIKGHSIFRLGGWSIALFVDHKAKQVIERLHVTGITCKPVPLS